MHSCRTSHSTNIVFLAVAVIKTPVRAHFCVCPVKGLFKECSYFQSCMGNRYCRRFCGFCCRNGKHGNFSFLSSPYISLLSPLLWVSGNISPTTEVCGFWGVPIWICVPVIGRIALQSFHWIVVPFLSFTHSGASSQSMTHLNRDAREFFCVACICFHAHACVCVCVWQDAAGLARPALCHRNSPKWGGAMSLRPLLLPLTDPISDASFSTHQPQALHFNTGL